ncbi:hypothetical protein SAMN02910289_00134 [Lachnospiraceae bacterium RM5]|nr:hypothetical protein SAMN02910289_00134 [Lachnospiraceae bacterium RM5]
MNVTSFFSRFNPNTSYTVYINGEDVYKHRKEKVNDDEGITIFDKGAIGFIEKYGKKKIVSLKMDISEAEVLIKNAMLEYDMEEFTDKAYQKTIAKRAVLFIDLSEEETEEEGVYLKEIIEACTEETTLEFGAKTNWLAFKEGSSFFKDNETRVGNNVDFYKRAEELKNREVKEIYLSITDPRGLDETGKNQYVPIVSVIIEGEEKGSI